VQCRQYNVKVFEVGLEEPSTFLEFLEANRVLLSNHLLSIQGEMNEEVLNYLEEQGFFYVFNMKLPPAKRGVERFRMLVSEEEASLPLEVRNALESLRDKLHKEESPRDLVSLEETESERGEEEPLTQEPSQERVEEDREAPLRVVNHALRSGQVVEHSGGVLLTDRINSGAKVAALGSVVALGTVEGDISSVGECVIVPPMKRGTLLFHGVKVENELLEHPLNKISFVGDHLTIQPVKSIKQRSHA